MKCIYWLLNLFDLCPPTILQMTAFFFFLKILQLTTKDVYLSYLPLAHIFDRVIEELFISHGASIGFWRGVSMFNSSTCFVMGTVVIVWALAWAWDTLVMVKLFSLVKQDFNAVHAYISHICRMSNYCLKTLGF